MRHVMPERWLDFSICRLGECRISSPMPIMRFIDEVKKLNIRHILEKPFSFEELLRILKNTRLRN